MLYQHFYIDYSTMDHKLVPMGSNTEICQVTESMISSSLPLPSYSYSSSVSSSFSGSFSYLEHSSYMVPEHSNKMETLENATPFLYQDSNQRNIPANVAVVPFQNLQITNQSNASFSRVSPIPERPRLNDTFFDSITPFISHENDHINYPISSLQKTAFFDTANIEECSHYDENDFDIGGDLIIDCSPKEDSMFQLAEDKNPDFYQQPNNNEENVSLVANQQQHAAVDYRQSSISEESIAFEEKSQKENHDPAAVVTKNSKKGEKNRNGCFRKFPNKLWDLASDDSFAAINWTEDGKLVCIDTKKLQPQLNRYFRTERFSSFLRQLHLYGFRKIRRSHNIPNINIRKFVYYQLKNFTRSTTDYQPVLG